MDKTAAGMETDKKICLVVVGQRCAHFQVQLVIIRAGQDHPVFPLQLGCQYPGQAQRNRFFGGAIGSFGTGFISPMTGIYGNDPFIGLK